MVLCIHCDEIAITALFNQNDVEKRHPFCCYGCRTVYNIIHQKGLESYYDIKQMSGLYRRRSPVEIKSARFLFLDDPQFLNEYSYHNSQDVRTMEFYLEGIHCLACLWLIEKLPEILNEVVSSKLDLDRSVVTVVLKDGGEFSAVARELNGLG